MIEYSDSQLTISTLNTIKNHITINHITITSQFTSHQESFMLLNSMFIEKSFQQTYFIKISKGLASSDFHFLFFFSFVLSHLLIIYWTKFSQATPYERYWRKSVFNFNHINHAMQVKFYFRFQKQVSI